MHCYGSVGGNFTAEVPTQFTVLPVGFRPTHVIASPAACRDTNGGGIGAAVIDVTQTSLGGYIDVITSVNANYIYFATSFVAAES